jgi:Xaa-Pro aminopeptidase
MADIGKARRAIAEEKLGGWLFFNVHHKDIISDRILDISPAATNTRPWLYLIRSDGKEQKLVHAIEAGILDHLPGDTTVYGSWEVLVETLKCWSDGLGPAAAQFSPDLPAISFLDHGQALLLEECGFELCSSVDLIQLFLGVLDEEGIRSHEQAADKLYLIVDKIWQRIQREMCRDEAITVAVTEGQVQDWILALFDQMGLISDSPPLVAAGPNSADPHYSPPQSSASSGETRGAVLKRGHVLQLDLWAREDRANSIYADISWVGILDTHVPEECGAVFDVLCQARNLAVAFIEERWGEPLKGQDVDRAVRRFLKECGYGAYLKHRTGHGIDTQVHGFGVNLDDVEFPDSRKLLEGSCFSVEPGLYLTEFGMRTEIDVYVRNGRPVVSGGTPQNELLTFS